MQKDKKLERIEYLVSQLIKEHELFIRNIIKKIKEELKIEKAEKIKKNREIHKEYLKKKFS